MAKLKHTTEKIIKAYNLTQAGEKVRNISKALVLQNPYSYYAIMKSLTKAMDGSSKKTKQTELYYAAAAIIKARPSGNGRLTNGHVMPIEPREEAQPTCDNMEKLADALQRFQEAIAEVIVDEAQR